MNIKDSETENVNKGRKHSGTLQGCEGGRTECEKGGICMAEKDNMKVNTSPVADVETGTAEDVEAIMKSMIVNRIPESGKAFQNR